MKKINFLFITLTCFVLLNSCKKDENNTGLSAPTRSISILTEYAPAPTGGFVKNRFILLDIDHANNSDKKFMIVDIVEHAGGYKFQVAEGSKPITEYSTNWPAQVKKIVSGSGLAHDFTVSAYLKMRASGTTRPYTFLFDSVHKFLPLSTVIIPINEMHNTIYAGSMAAKEPQAAIELWGPGRPNPVPPPVNPNDSLPDYFFFAQYQRVSRPVKLYFYFTEGYYTSVVSPLNTAISTEESVFRAINAMSGKADAVISYEGTTSVLFFFDFDKWEFMTVKFPCFPVYGATCLNTIEISPVKSMNTLIAWPAGWAP